MTIGNQIQYFFWENLINNKNRRVNIDHNSIKPIYPTKHIKWIRIKDKLFC